ncbi:uncharacterized protein LKV04_022235 [Tautogolabrus adspersus]
MDEQVNPLDRDHSLSVVLPGGLEKHATVHGSKPVMDLLVTLCASYHLNPSDYTVEVLSTNKNNIRFKPNSPIGSLEAEKIVLKPKGIEEKIRRPYMPEPSVRLLINYNKSHKAVVRVNPKVPLELLMPVVCDKCEFQVETTVLLRDSQSKEPLDLTKSLDDHSLREVFAKDTAVEHQHRSKTPETAVTPAEVITPPPLQDFPKTEKKQKENNGFLSLFRRRKKKPQTEGTASAPASPGLKVGVSANVQSISSSSFNTLTADMPKKRRAPPATHWCITEHPQQPRHLSSQRSTGGPRSAESTLRSTKRRAPPPPCTNNHQELQAHTEVKGTLDSLRPLAELGESDESDSITLSSSSSSSPLPSHSHSRSSSSRPSLSHLQDVGEHLPSLRGKDLSEARCALAKVLTSSISKGALMKRFSSSSTLPKSNSSSSFIPMTHRRSENGADCVELEPVLTSNLTAEPEWEDPIQRRLLTTFKVVPSRKQRSTDREITLKVPEQITLEEIPKSEASREVIKDQTEKEEDSSCLDESQAETSLSSPERSSQEASDMCNSLPNPLDFDKNLDCQNSTPSEVGETFEIEEEEEPEVTSEVQQAAEELPSEAQIHPEDEGELLLHPSTESVRSDSAHCGSNTNEEDAEEEAEEEAEDCFPPPPPPIYFNEDVEADKKEATNSSLPSNPTSNGQMNPPSEERQSVPTSSSPYMSAAAQGPVDEDSAAPSRFAQAVALAVQRSRIQSQGKSVGPQAPSGPNSTLPSSPRSIYQYGA